MNKQKLMGILLLSLVILISMVSFEVTETCMVTIMICAVAPVCVLIYDKFINQNKRVVHYFYGLPSLIYLLLCFENGSIHVIPFLSLILIFFIVFVTGIIEPMKSHRKI